jgi:hypothetical protein
MCNEKKRSHYRTVRGIINIWSYKQIFILTKKCHLKNYLTSGIFYIGIIQYKLIKLLSFFSEFSMNYFLESDKSLLRKSTIKSSFLGK